MLEYRVNARRLDPHGSEAACMIKNIERVARMLSAEVRGVEVRLHGVRQDSPPKLASLDYELIVDTDADDHKLELLLRSLRKYGTIHDTVAQRTRLDGRMVPRPLDEEIPENQ